MYVALTSRTVLPVIVGPLKWTLLYSCYKSQVSIFRYLHEKRVLTSEESENTRFRRTFVRGAGAMTETVASVKCISRW